jgi:hypothetical protein
VGSMGTWPIWAIHADIWVDHASNHGALAGAKGTKAGLVISKTSSEYIQPLEARHSMLKRSPGFTHLGA